VTRLQNLPRHGSDGPANDAIQTLSSGAWLLLEEMSHRVANEYALAVSSISLAARRSPPEARAALLAVRDRLHGYADAHRAHLAPISQSADLSDYLGQLCLSLVRGHLAERGVALRFIADTIYLPSDACWRVGLIVSELITNALRHGVASPGGMITVELRVSAAGLDCAVRDNGGAAHVSPAGHGMQIIEGIAKELGGRINRSFARTGCCAVLSLSSIALVGSPSQSRAEQSGPSWSA
jgi:two-component sensor histidine kinase